MGRMVRFINYTLTSADTWYKVFDEADYKLNRVKEIKVKLRETTTADHFRYNADGNATVFMTSTSGFVNVRDVKQLYAYIPDVAAQVLEIEIVYK